jgi:hypothetical protein
MLNPFAFLTLLGLAGPPLAAPTAPATPVSTVAIGATEQLRATLTLANHNTLLFFPTLNSPNVRIVALRPTGQVAWETQLHKAQTVKVAKAGLVDLRDRKLISISPLRLISVGDQVYTVETIADEAPDKSGPPLHSLVVQELDASGHLATKVFTVPQPEAKTTRQLLTAFAEPGVVYAVAKEENKREETNRFFLVRCDFATGKSTQLPLDLPAAGPVKHDDEFFRDWVFGGARAGECYFYRALKGSTPKDDARETPVEFEVKRVGTDGRTQATFTTALHKNLPTGTFVQGDIWYPHYGQAHAPKMLERNTSVYDLYTVSTGANAEFYLDPATGNCQFTGQYSPKLYDARSTAGPSQGTFVQRYGPDGTLLKAVTTPYEGLAGFKPSQFLFSPSGYLLVNLAYAPDTQDLTLQYWTKDHFVVTSYDAQLQARPLQFVARPERKPNPYFDSQLISWSGPNYLQGSGTGDAQPQLLVDGLLASPVGLHKSIGQLVDGQIALANQRKSKVELEYTVSPTGAASALVLEAPEEAGGQVNVYEVK